MSLFNEFLGALFLGSYFVVGSLIYYYVILSQDD